MKRVYLPIILLLSFAVNVRADIVPSPGVLTLTPQPAPALSLTDLDGHAYNLKQDRGHWVFVHFWASWCGPCRRELPTLQAMWQEMQSEGLRLVVINTAEDEDTVFSFLSSTAPALHPYMDRDGLVTEAWKPRGLPATFLVDPQGQVRYQALGGRDWHEKEYMEFLRRLTQP